MAAKHLLARVSCSGRCLMGAFTRIQIGRSRTRLTQYSDVYLLKKAGRRTIKIGFDRKTLGKLRAALVRGQRVTATIYGAILDPGGNVESRTRGREMRVRH